MPNRGDKRVAGAIDFGGTKLLVGLVSSDGTVLAQQRVPTPYQGGPAGVADQAVLMLRNLLAQEGITTAQLAGLGSTVPGLAETRKGILRLAPALGWRDVPFAQMLADRTGVEARIANDVNACALAEQRFGVGRGVESLVWITVSTGVGGSVVLDGKIVEGASGIAGEIGHLVVEEGGYTCGCGHRGCLEAMAAGPAIARRARESGLQVADSAEVATLARSGDPIARRILTETAVYLGRAIAFCYNLLDPDMVVIGGGVGQSFDLLLPTLDAVVADRAIRLADRPHRIMPTGLGYEAALVGAAALVL